MAEAAHLTIEQQLVNSTTSYRDAKEVLARETERWQQLIVDAVDEHGLTIKKVASVVGVATSRIHTIIATVYARAS